MTLPDYKRPFSSKDFRGYFKWSKKLSSELSSNLYHACHKDELIEILENNELSMRSNWAIKLPKHGLCEIPGVWVGLNYFSNGNNYGPFLIEWPIEVLNGKSFMVFRRESTDRNRYFFVQYESRIPIYSFDGDLWRKVNPKVYFQKHVAGTFSHKTGAIYDIVLTQPITLNNVSIKGVKHPSCIPQKCSGLSTRKAQDEMLKIAIEEAEYYLNQKGITSKLLKKFPGLEGEKIELSEFE